jgi:hypothetical protein
MGSTAWSAWRGSFCRFLLPYRLPKRSGVRERDGPTNPPAVVCRDQFDLTDKIDRTVSVESAVGPWNTPQAPAELRTIAKRSPADSKPGVVKARVLKLGGEVKFERPAP